MEKKYFNDQIQNIDVELHRLYIEVEEEREKLLQLDLVLFDLGVNEATKDIYNRRSINKPIKLRKELNKKICRLQENIDNFFNL
jgi:hypothetical protein